MTDWHATNRAWWDERAPHHAAGAFYDVAGFRAGASTLRPFEPAELGDVSGRDLVHLQCHFGLDTLSWARRGARVTGLDYSAPAVATAAALADGTGLDARFVEADVYDAVSALGAESFDIVYTGIGALCWLPDIPRWATVVRELLRPGGVLYLVETHPMSDVLGDDDLVARYPYFHDAPIRDDSQGSYAIDGDVRLETTVTYSWIHPLGRVVGALLDAGLSLELLNEHDFTVFARWPFMRDDGEGTYRLPDDLPRLPLLYSLRARRGGDGATA
jgi:SAM-dependent methyltransferase